jgi:hypothetical protein
MAENTMGFNYGGAQLTDPKVYFKRKYRWRFFIPEVCGRAEKTGSPLLPPGKAGRPSLSFKEIDAQHVTETVYFPGKPEWKPISLTLYDISNRGDGVSLKNPVIEWIKKLYEVSDQSVNWKTSSGFKQNCSVEAYDGVGNIVEEWKLENVWPISIDFGELDYSQSDIMTIDLQLRYDRAYIIEHTEQFEKQSTKYLDRSSGNNYSFRKTIA